LEGIAPEALLSNPVFPLSRAADRIGGVIVLKSHVTWIMGTGQNLRVFDGMNAALATAGSGDVLAGLVGGFLASGLESPIDAASGAVIAHALAGRRARKKFGWFDAFGLAAEAAVLLGDDHDATRY